MRVREEDAAGRSPRVLVVEPDRNASDRLARILEEAGTELLTTERAAQGVELFSREQADLVLAAADLPDLSVVNLLKRVARPRAPCVSP